MIDWCISFIHRHNCRTSLTYLLKAIALSSNSPCISFGRSFDPKLLEMALLQRSYVPFLYVKRIQIASTAKVTNSLGAPCSSTLLSGGIRHNSTQDRSTKNHGNPLSPPSSSKHRRLSSLPVDYHDHENEDNVGKDMNFNNVETSPSHLSYVADISYPITSHLNIIKPKEDAPSGIWPVYRMMVSSIHCDVLFVIVGTKTK